MSKITWKYPRLAAITAAVAALVAGCGSSSSSSSTSTAASGSASSAGAGTANSAAVSAAKATVSQFAADQPTLTIAALPKKPPTGKTVAVLTCGFPSCQATTVGVVSGAKALGWNVKTYTSQITPEGYTATWNQMLQNPPSAIVYTGLLPNATIQPQLAKVASLHIPTVGIAGWDPPGSVLKAVYSGQPTLTQSGKVMGAAVVADAGGPAKTVFVWDPKTLMGPVDKAFTGEVTGAGGSVDELHINLADTGTAVPGQVVSYLQAHPDTKYAVFAISDFAAGVPQALKAAGIKSVKIVSRAAHPNNVADITSGSEFASVAEETDGSGFRAVDALARLFENSPYQSFPPGWARLLDKANIPASNSTSVLSTPGVPAAFLRAWHVQ